MMKVIGVKFCGNCNPVLDSAGLFKFLQERFPQYRFVTGDYADIDCLLIISGCEVDCATRPRTNVPVISVAGHSLDRIRLSLEELKQQLLDRLEGQNC